MAARCVAVLKGRLPFTTIDWKFQIPLVAKCFLGSLLVLLLLSGVAEGRIRHVYLTYQHDPRYFVTVNVHGIDTPKELAIHYAKEPKSPTSFVAIGEGKREVSLPDERRLYHIELSDLEPGTTYYFSVQGKEEALTEEISFRTLPEEEYPLRFVEGGDWENTKAAALLAKRAASFSPMAALLGGDYPSHAIAEEDFLTWDHWLDTYTRTMRTPEGHLIPMVMAVGNHEVRGGFDRTRQDAPFFFHYFPQGSEEESYFTLPLGKEIRLFVLDSGHAARHEGEQLEWLVKAMEEAQEIPVKMALYHVPIYPSIRFMRKNLIYCSLYGLTTLFKGARSSAKLFSKQSVLGQKYWRPLFDQYDMTVAFEHHEQTLKRTKLLKGGREDACGTLYLGDGGWGPAIQYAPLQGYFHTYFASLQGKKHFFWLVEIDRDHITYSAVTEAGLTIDQFRQDRMPQPASSVHPAPSISHCTQSDS